MEVCRYHFGGAEHWFLQYNTQSFGLLQDMSTLGLKVWPICPVLCTYLCSDACAPPVAARRCLELGAGIGMLGSVLGSLDASVTVTDDDEACLRVAAVNLRLNGADASRCRVQRLAYGAEPAERFAAVQGRFELIFGSDIVYSAAAAAPVFASVERLLDVGGSFFLGFAPRVDIVQHELLRAAREAGFCWQEPCVPAEPKAEGLSETFRAVQLQRASGSSLSSAFMAVEGKGRARLYHFVRRPTAFLDEMD